MKLKKMTKLVLILLLFHFPLSNLAAEKFIEECMNDNKNNLQALVKSGFEDGTTMGWQPFGPVILSTTKSVANSGQFSLEVSNRTAAFNGPGYNLTSLIKNNQKLAATAIVYYERGSDAETFRITIRRRLTNAGDTFTNIAIQNVPRGHWTVLTGTYTLTNEDTLEDLLIYLECANPNLTFYTDDLSISTPKDHCLQKNIPAIYKVYKNYFSIGSVVSIDALNGDFLTELLTMHFNSITPAKDFQPINIAPHAGAFNFSRSDIYANFAQAHNLTMRGHTLIWHHQVPNWFFIDEKNQPVKRDVLLERMKNYIRMVVGRYKGIVQAWDVVTEAIDTSAPQNLRLTPWLQIIGPDYIEKAFFFAREADPDARLFYNDFGTEEPGKRKAIYNLVKKLKQKLVPIDGIGIAGHINIFAPNVREFEETIRTFSKLKVELQITELDMSVYRDNNESTFGCPPQERLINQGLKYAALFEMFKKYRAQISNITFWGIKDDLSWLNSFFVDRNDFPLLFTSNLKTKYAYWGVVAPALLPDIIKLDKQLFEIATLSDQIP